MKIGRNRILFISVVIFIATILVLKNRYEQNKLETPISSSKKALNTNSYFNVKQEILGFENATVIEDNIKIQSIFIEYRNELGDNALVIIKDSIVGIISKYNPVITNYITEKNVKQLSSNIINIIESNISTIPFLFKIKPLRIRKKGVFRVYIKATNNELLVFEINKGNKENIINTEIIQNVKLLYKDINNIELDIESLIYEKETTNHSDN